MKQLIGDKQVFAIEFELERLIPQPFGKLCLWLNGIRVGAFDDSHLINTSLCQIGGILNRPLSNAEYAGLSAERVFEIVKGRGLGDYFLNIGESFDDFSMVVYKHGFTFYIIWQLHDQTFFEYPDHPNGMQSCNIKSDIIDKVVNDARDVISSSNMH